MLIEGVSRLLVLLSVLHDSSSSDYLNDGKQQQQQKYAVVFDAGSTGSRVHVFSFDTNMVLLPIGQDYEFYLAITPGLSSYENDPNGGAESLRPLLEQAEAVIPQDLHSNTPLRLGATAGLRQLSGNASEAILEAVKGLFEESSLDYRPEWVSVLDGSDEGAYMWVAMNYLVGSLVQGQVSKTIGVIDLGGGSVQMAYVVSEAAASNAPPLYVSDKLVLGNTYHLYSHSYLNYGLKAARAESLKLSLGRGGNPCVTNGYEGTYDYNGETYNVAPPRSGTSMRRCRALARKMLKLDAPCSHANCSFDGVWNGGGGDGLNNLYAASFFYETAAETGIVEPNADTALIRPIAYKNAAKRACSANVDNIKSFFPLMVDIDLGFLCMDLVYEYTLLVDGFGIHPYKEITVVYNVDYNGSPIGAAWPLGCAVQLLSG